MTLATDKREALIMRLAREVTFEEEPPYPELRRALEALVDCLEAGEAPSSSVDWAAIISEAVTLRPSH